MTDPLEAAAKVAVGKAIVEAIRDVAELPDRTSPDDYPERMLVTAEELFPILSGLVDDVTAPLLAETARLTRELEEAKDQMQAWMRKRDRAYVERDAAEAQLARAREAMASATLMMDGGRPFDAYQHLVAFLNTEAK